MENGRRARTRTTPSLIRTAGLSPCLIWDSIGFFVFRLDAANGKLTPNDPPFVATRAGAGPRHIAFHPKMPLAYVINELGSSVATYRFDPQRGSLQPIQILPSTPADYTGNNHGAEIAVALSAASSMRRTGVTTASRFLPSIGEMEP